MKVDWCHLGSLNSAEYASYADCGASADLTKLFSHTSKTVQATVFEIKWCGCALLVVWSRLLGRGHASVLPLH